MTMDGVGIIYTYIPINLLWRWRDDGFWKIGRLKVDEGEFDAPLNMLWEPFVCVCVNAGIDGQSSWWSHYFFGNKQAFKCHGGSRLSTVADSRLNRKQMVSSFNWFKHVSHVCPSFHLFGIVDTWNMSSKIIDVHLRIVKCLLVDEQLTVCQPVWVTFMISFFMPRENIFAYETLTGSKMPGKKSKTFIGPLEVPSLKVTFCASRPEISQGHLIYTPSFSLFWPGSYMPL